MMMRLCYLAHPRSIHTRRWLEYFVRRGHEVHLLTFYTDFPSIEGVKTHPILPSCLSGIRRGRGWLALLFPWRIRQLIRTIAPDVLHAHFISFYGWMAAMSDFHPFVLTIWGSDLLVDNGAADRLLRYWLIPFTLREADLVTAVSQNLLTVASQHTDHPINGHVIRIGADLSDFNPSSDAKLWKVRLELNEGHPVILSPRVINPLYNIHTIVAAIPHVLEQIPDALFVFKDNVSIGQEYESYRLRVRQMITEMKIEKAVRFVGEVPYHEMASFYRLADVVVSVALSEGFPATVFEAMACGVPMVVGKIPQLAEIIADGENALTVPVEDPQQLAEAIVRLLRDEALRQKMIAANLALVKERGDFQAEMGRMEKLYEKLLPQDVGQTLRDGN
jgi:glycosyltransferase involved in cell wall biosynthesis